MSANPDVPYLSQTKWLRCICKASAVITFSAGWIHPLIHCQSFICHRVSTGNFTIRSLFHNKAPSHNCWKWHWLKILYAQQWEKNKTVPCDAWQTTINDVSLVIATKVSTAPSLSRKHRNFVSMDINWNRERLSICSAIRRETTNNVSIYTVAQFRGQEAPQLGSPTLEIQTGGEI